MTKVTRLHMQSFYSMCYPAVALTSAASVSTQGVATPTDSAANIASATGFSTKSVATAWLDTPPGLPSPPGFEAIVSTQGVAPALSLPAVFTRDMAAARSVGNRPANTFLKEFRAELHSQDKDEIDLTDGLRFDWKGYVHFHRDRIRMARAPHSSPQPHPPPQIPSLRPHTLYPIKLVRLTVRQHAPPCQHAHMLAARPHECLICLPVHPSALLDSCLLCPSSFHSSCALLARIIDCGITRFTAHRLAAIDPSDKKQRVDFIVHRCDGTATRLHPHQSKLRSSGLCEVAPVHGKLEN